MSDRFDDHVAEWQQEAAYHLARAAQERDLADRAESTEVRAAHAVLAQTHLTRAGTAEAAAKTPDPAPVHDPRINAVRDVIRESFALPRTDTR